MKSARRTTTSVRANLHSLTREPFTLALLVLMPAVSIQLFGMSVGSMANLGLFEMGTSLRTVGMVTGALFASSALAGILGLFQSINVQSADSRLVVSGYRRTEMMAARFTTVLATSLLVAVVTTISLGWLVEGNLGPVAVTTPGLFLASGLYGFFGVLVGSVLPRKLEGSLVLVALADVGAIIASGLFGVEDSLASLFPLSHHHDVVLQAVVEGSVATGHLLSALGYLVGIIFVTAIALLGVLPSGGDAV